MNSDVAILTTGGTIGSEVNNNELDTSKNILSNKINKYTNVDSFSIMNKLSENMIPKDWFTIANAIQDIIDKGYNNIIITHGTDTITYSASAIEILFGYLQNVSIIFTGTMDSPDINKIESETALKSSLDAIQNLSNGVYINIRSPEKYDKMILHQATNVKPLYYDSKGYESINNKYIGEYTDSWNFVNTYSKNYSLPYVSNINIHDKIEYRKVYPGIKIENTSNIDLIILDAYHSGTVPANNKNNSIMNTVKNKNIPIILLGYDKKLQSHIYSSTSKLINNGLYLIKNMQPHVAYVYFYIGMAQNIHIQKLINKIK